MSLTSFAYLVFLGIGVVVYYIIPRKIQWILLLGLSVTFYYSYSAPYTIVYLLFSTTTAYAVTIIAEKYRGKDSKLPKKISTAVGIVIVLNLLLFFILKCSGIYVPVSKGISFLPTLSAFPHAAALGMGYYTLQIIGYILDCYWGNQKPQKNLLKLFLFVSFFPQMTVGPISRYHNLETLYTGHSFSIMNVSMGVQRILWGFFKKLIIAERAGLFVNGIWADTVTYSGWWHWIALILYPVQMYVDFSGGVDIVIGSAQVFGIDLAENFNNPFFSRNSQEFWRRWHITLGTWAKDYVLYPLLISEPMVKFNKWSRKRFGKKVGKLIPTQVGMFVLWIVIGAWHGGYKFIVGVSLWYWAVLLIAEIFKNGFSRANEALHFKTESFSWHLFQSMRTYLIYAVGAVFFFAPTLHEAVDFLKSLVSMFLEDGKNNPWIFFDGSFQNMGITYRDVNLLIFGIMLLLIVGVLREKYGYARTWVAKQGFLFRWFVWLALFVLVLVYGMYGPGYSADEFIYQGF